VSERKEVKKKLIEKKKKKSTFSSWIFFQKSHVLDFQLLHDGGDGLRSALVEQKAQFLLVFLHGGFASTSVARCQGLLIVCHLEVHHHRNVDWQRRRLRVDALQRTHQRRAHLVLLGTRNGQSHPTVVVASFEQKVTFFKL
jgi:hypothetical protein